MAENNTTTYNVVVDTEVKGQDQLEGVGDAAETTGGKFTRLQRQIRDTQVALQQAAESGDTVKFNKLKADLDELQDKLELTQLSSQQFDDALAGLPGPAGQAGQAIKSLDGVFKAFLANPILVTIAAIVGVFVSLKEALSRTEEGQAKLNKISEGFTKILNGLFAILEPIANLFADLIIGLMENEAVMNGLAKTAGVLSAAFTVVFNVGKQLVGFIVNNMVNAFKTLVDVAGGAGKVLKGVFTFDLDLIKEGVSQVSDGIKKGFNATVDNVKNTVKGIGEGVVDGIKDGFSKGESQFKKGQARLTEAQKKAQEERNKKAQEANKKLSDEEKKLQEQRVKDIEAGNKAVTEAYLAGLDARDREIYKRGETLNENLVVLEKRREAQIADVLKKAGVNISKVVDETGKIKFDLPNVKSALQKNATEVAKIDDEFKSSRLLAQEAYNKDVAAINTKFDEEEAKKREEKKQKEREAAKAAYEEAVMANENRVQAIEQAYNKEIALVNEKEKLKIEALKLATSEILKNITLTEDERRDAVSKGLSESEALEQKRQKIIKDSVANILQLITLSEEERAAAIAKGLTETEALELKRKELITLSEEERKAAISNGLTEAQALELKREQIIRNSSANILQLIKLTEEERADAISKGLTETEALEQKREQIIKDGAANIQQIITLTEEEKIAAIANGLTETEALEQKLQQIIKDGSTAIQQIESDASKNRLALQQGRYDELITAINEREKILLSNTELTEAQKTKILLDAEDARTALRQESLQNQLLENENAFSLLESKYNREIALVNEKEALLTSAVGLSEEERKKLVENASITRIALQQQRYDEQIALINERERLLLSNTALTEAERTKIIIDAEQQRKDVQQTRLDDTILGIDTELNALTTSFDRRRELAAQKEAELLAQEGLTENQRTQIRQQGADERAAIDMAELEARAELQTAYLDLAQNFGSFLQQIAGKNKKLAIAGVIVEQAAAIGKIVVNTGIANAKALAASPLTFGMPWVAINTVTAGLSIAASIAGAVKAIQQIKNSDSGQPATGGTSSLPKSSGGGGGMAPAAPTAAGTIPVPQIVGTQTQATPGAQIAQTIGAASGKPVKAYVVSGDVTSQQALDRRTTRAATFSGGTNG